VQLVMNQNMTGIVRLSVNANNFELKPTLINMIQLNQFKGSSQKDASTYLASSLDLCNVIKFNEVSDDAVNFKLFHFSL
jgi:hypothetical protein